MSAKRVRVRGQRRTGHRGRTQGDFSLQVLVNREGVFFDQIYHGEEEKKLFLIMTDKEMGRKLGKWLVKACA